MIYLGIDPGLSGGFAFINEAGRNDAPSIQLFRMPLIGDKDYDVQEMKRLLLIHLNGSIFATIEKQVSMPGQGLTSTFKTGQGFGILIGLLSGLEISYQIIPAPKWQRTLFVGQPAKQDTKVSSEIIAKRLFPTTDFRKSDRARIAADGLTDAACIAEYGRRTHGGGVIRQENLTAHTPNPENVDICLKCGAFIPSSDAHCIPT